METNEWKDKVRAELIEVIDKFLAVSDTGGWGIRYQNPVKESYEDGSKLYDKEKVSGVDVFIQFGFEQLLVIVPEENKS